MFGRGHKLLNVPDSNLVSPTKLHDVPDTIVVGDKNKIDFFGSLATQISEHEADTQSQSTYQRIQKGIQ